MPNIAVSESDTLSPREVKKRRETAMVPFTVSKEKFSYWFQETVKRDIDWTNPMIGHMFQSWVAGHGAKEWVTDEELEARVVKHAKALATKAKNDALRAAAELKGER